MKNLNEQSASDFIESIWNSLPGAEIIAGKPQSEWDAALRHAFAVKLVQELNSSVTPPAWDGNGLPPVGAEVLIRHGRDDDDHLCVVTGFYVLGSLNGDSATHRIFVELV